MSTDSTWRLSSEERSQYAREILVRGWKNLEGMATYSLSGIDHVPEEFVPPCPTIICFAKEYAEQIVEDHNKVLELKNTKLGESIKHTENLEYVLKQIMQDLPANQNWLDPGIEKLARALLRDKGTSWKEVMNASDSSDDQPVPCCAGSLKRHVESCRNFSV